MLNYLVDLAVEHKEVIGTAVPLIIAWLTKIYTFFTNRKAKVVYSLVSQALFQDTKTAPPGLIATRTYAVRNIGRKTAENVMFHVGAPNHLLSIVPDISASINYLGNTSAVAQIQYLNRHDKFEVTIIAMGDTCGELMAVRHKDGVGTIQNMAISIEKPFYLKWFFNVMYLAGIASSLLILGYVFRSEISKIIDLIIPIIRKLAA